MSHPVAAGEEVLISAGFTTDEGFPTPLLPPAQSPSEQSSSLQDVHPETQGSGPESLMPD